MTGESEKAGSGAGEQPVPCLIHGSAARVLIGSLRLVRYVGVTELYVQWLMVELS